MMFHFLTWDLMCQKWSRVLGWNDRVSCLFSMLAWRLKQNSGLIDLEYGSVIIPTQTEGFNIVSMSIFKDGLVKPQLKLEYAWVIKSQWKQRLLSFIDAMILVNILRPRQNGRYFPDDIFRSVFMNDKFCILINISLNFVPEGPIDNNPSLV